MRTCEDRSSVRLSAPVAIPKGARFPFTVVWAAVAGCAAALLVLYILVMTNYEVLDKGALLPYTSAELYRIELFGRFTLYAQPEAKTSFDILDSWILISVSSVALLALIFLWAGRLATRARTAVFFLTAWLGAGFLAVDEILGVHENLGHNLRLLADFPGIERPDDAVLALYTLPVIGFLFAFRRIILGSRAARLFIGLGAAIFLVAAAADVLDMGRDEELVETIASFVLLLGFMILTVGELRRVAARSTDDLSSVKRQETSI